MRRLVVGLAVALVGLTLISLGQNVSNRHSIEDELTGRSDRALAEAGIGAEVSFVGRDGTVRVRSAADEGRALAVVERVTGVRVARVEVVPAPVEQPRPLPRVRIGVDGATVSASGSVPTEAAKAALGGGDQLVVDPRVAGTGLDGLPAVVSALGGDAEGVVIELSGGRLTLTGTVSSPAVRDAAVAAARQVSTDVVDRLRVRESPQQALSSLPRVTFANDSATLTAQGRRVVVGVAEILEANPAVRVSIQGHTDSNGSDAANLALSRARAQTVLDTLVSLGIAADRLTAAGFGESRPKVPNTSEANRAVNRRVEFVVR